MAVELSVAIIFKNEIRCIERCLRSLLPLKERFSCEIVMADTGSTDGSRTVAEQYADVVFDFPWINDFAAARNAVLDHCFGRWVLVLDCDEWLDPDLGELADFLHGKASAKQIDYAMLTMHDYTTKELTLYNEFMAHRLLRMESGPRYEGSIHEHVVYRYPLGRSRDLRRTVLYHDGYVMLNDGSKEGRAKRDRNRAMLKKQLERDPDDLLALLHYVNSSDETDPDYPSMLQRAMELVEQRAKHWKEVGPVLFRNIAFKEFSQGRTGWSDLLRKCRELFPDSYYTRIDGEYLFLSDALDRRDWSALIAHGEAYLSACAAFLNDPRGLAEISNGALNRNGPRWVQPVVLRLANAYCESGDAKRAQALLKEIDWTQTNRNDVRFFILIMEPLAKQGVDIGPLLSACWDGIQKPVPSAERAQERVAVFCELVKVEKTRDEQTERACDEAPVLSVAILFKNEIRCIERCLKSLLPLKERFSCEIVMADTGSSDGSRTVAEQYADKVIDFPWIDDFSAARNAALDHCSGRWTLTIDCDEWLDPDADELTEFLCSADSERRELAGVVVRNYTEPGLTAYGDAIAPRMVRMAAGPRYRGAIHEAPVFAVKPRDALLPRTILHHDGYVMLNENSEEGSAKRARNTTLLRKELAREPDNLQRLQQFIDAAEGEPDHLEMLRRAVALVGEKKPGWSQVGAPILRTAAEIAFKEGLPEETEWTRLAISLFPDSYFTRIDLAVVRMQQANRKGNLALTASLCEEFLAACAEATAHRERLAEQLQYGVLYRFNPYAEQYIRIRLIEANRVLGRFDRIPSLFSAMAWDTFDGELTRDLLLQIEKLPPGNGLDLPGLLATVWDGIQQPEPSLGCAEERAAAFRTQLRGGNSAAAELFSLATRVRTILEKLPPEDPAVLDLKSSDAYRKVAPLIEGGAV